MQNRRCKNPESLFALWDRTTHWMECSRERTLPGCSVEKKDVRLWFILENWKCIENRKPTLGIFFLAVVEAISETWARLDGEPAAPRSHRRARERRSAEDEADGRPRESPWKARVPPHMHTTLRKKERWQRKILFSNYTMDWIMTNWFGFGNFRRFSKKMSDNWS